MKKKYIQPNVSVSFIVVESELLFGSVGAQREQNDDFITFSKQHDFTDDSFDDTAWPKGKSPWED